MIMTITSKKATFTASSSSSSSSWFIVLIVGSLWVASHVVHVAAVDKQRKRKLHKPRSNSRRRSYNFDCGCPDTCTNDILKIKVGGKRGRIGDVIEKLLSGGTTEQDACRQVCGVEYSSRCGGQCDPNVCGSAVPEASAMPSSQPSISPTPTASPMPSSSTTMCGCNACTEEALDSMAGAYSCGDRINHLISTGKSEYDACARVCNVEYPFVCGPNCDPIRCNPVTFPDPDSSKLIWSDEFNNDGRPNATKWGNDFGDGGWGNNELQEYTNSINNAYISNGILHIRAVKEAINGGEYKYTSSRMVTRNLGDWKYGRIRVRARVRSCSAVGTWPAIWMLPTDWFYGDWPKSGEIDIMEYVGYQNDIFHGSVHTESYNHMIGSQHSSAIVASDDSWHVFEIIWQQDIIEFGIDTVKYTEFRRSPSATYAEWPLDQRFHLIMNVAVGGNWGGQQGVDSAAFDGDGQIMEVDYVQVYSL